MQPTSCNCTNQIFVDSLMLSNASGLLTHWDVCMHWLASFYSQTRALRSFFFFLSASLYMLTVMVSTAGRSLKTNTGIHFKIGSLGSFFFISFFFNVFSFLLFNVKYNTLRWYYTVLNTLSMVEFGSLGSFNNLQTEEMKPRNIKAMHLFMQNRCKAERIQYLTFASEVKFVAVVSNDRVTAHLSWLRRKTGSGNQMSRTCNKSVYNLLYTCILPIIIIIIIITLMDATFQFTST